MRIRDIVISDYACQILNRPKTATVKITPLAKGGSDRIFRRVRFREDPSVIFMYYDSLREENRYYAGIAGFLKELGLAVPVILDHDPDRCFILMEDFGDTDLWSFRQSPWGVLCGYYKKILRMIDRLHAFSVKDLAQRELPLMQGFGPELYQWERDYFRENFVRGICGVDPGAREEATLESELNALAERLGESGVSLVHRDLQSQNILIYREDPVLIDFQGLRQGSYFYDLASLLYDPYAPLNGQQRLELLRYYYDLRERCFKWEDFQEIFHEAAVQRVMQALGAFAFLGRRHNRADFLTHIPEGLQRLAEAASHSLSLPALQGMISRCQAALQCCPPENC